MLFVGVGSIANGKSTHSGLGVSERFATTLVTSEGDEGDKLCRATCKCSREYLEPTCSRGLILRCSLATQGSLGRHLRSLLLIELIAQGLVLVTMDDGLAKELQLLTRCSQQEVSTGQSIVKVSLT